VNEEALTHWGLLRQIKKKIAGQAMQVPGSLYSQNSVNETGS